MHLRDLVFPIKLLNSSRNNTTVFYLKLSINQMQLTANEKYSGSFF